LAAGRTRKSPENLRRNAKTRWGEPAGQFASSHLAVALLVEAAGIVNPSSDNRRNSLVFSGLGVILKYGEWLFHSLIRSLLVRYQIMSDQF